MLAAAYEDKITFLASGLTFDLVLAALPFTILLLAALGYFVHAGAEAVNDAQQVLSMFIPSVGPTERDPLAEAQRWLSTVGDSRRQLSLLGLPLFLWFSTRFFGGARLALNEVFDTTENRTYLAGKLVDLFLVLASLVLFVVNAVLTVIVVDSPWLGRFVGTVSSFVLALLLFFLVYVIAPTRRARLDTALLAAVVASLGYEIGKKLYTVYIAEFATVDRLISNANLVALLLLGVWMYYSALVFLLGAEVAETYDLRRRLREQRAVLT